MRVEAKIDLTSLDVDICYICRKNNSCKLQEVWTLTKKTLVICKAAVPCNKAVLYRFILVEEI